MGVQISSPSPIEPPRPMLPLVIPQPVKKVEKIVASSNTVNIITPQSSSLSVEQPTNYKYQLLYLEQGTLKRNLNIIEPKDRSLRSRDTVYFLIENDPKYPKINLNKGFIAYFKTERGKSNRFYVSNISFV